MMTFMEAVGREEGVLVPGSRPYRNNNPGDIEWGKFAAAHGATGGDPRFAIFPDLATGYACMLALFQSNGYAGLTVEEALNKWAPPVENQTNIYVEHVCQWVPCNPTDLISTLL
jgi:hypothetical protein